MKKAKEKCLATTVGYGGAVAYSGSWGHFLAVIQALITVGFMVTTVSYGGAVAYGGVSDQKL